MGDIKYLIVLYFLLILRVDVNNEVLFTEIGHFTLCELGILEEGGTSKCVVDSFFKFLFLVAIATELEDVS